MLLAQSKSPRGVRFTYNAFRCLDFARVWELEDYARAEGHTEQWTALFAEVAEESAPGVMVARHGG